MTSKRIEAAEHAILPLARAVVPNARLISQSGREFYSCAIIVDTDAEKKLINDDSALLTAMRDAAEQAGRRPEYLLAESQETVDRRYGGNWNYVFR